MSDRNLQNDFIHQELTLWAEHVQRKLAIALRRRKIGYSDELLKSLSYRVVRGSDMHQGWYNLRFNEYGRMVDMGKGKIKKFSTVAGNTDALASAGKTRRAKKWYSKTAYGSLNRLIEAISNNYGLYTMQQIKNDLTEKP